MHSVGPDAIALFARTARALGDALRGLARERKDDPAAARDLTAAADALDRALRHIAP
jgi:hypothetical protein